MASQTPISIIPHAAELTTQQAADYLNVSRPHFVGLLDQGLIEHRKVGTHRRVRFGDLLRYEAKSKIERRAAIDEMVAQSKRLGLE
jgi:excisionase family DNA binding protein